MVTDMDYKYIDQLLERYWNAETSLEEEEILRAFFSQEEIPSELEQYRPLFVYEHQEPKSDVLGEEFDERILSVIEEAEPVKARTITLTQRLMPLFKAAAVVAVILTLSNAMQSALEDKQTVGGTAAIEATQTGVSVAQQTGDSTKVDSMRQSLLHE